MKGKSPAHLSCPLENPPTYHSLENPPFIILRFDIGYSAVRFSMVGHSILDICPFQVLLSIRPQLCYLFRSRLNHMGARTARDGRLFSFD